MTNETARVLAWEEVVEIPTYGVGKPDKNPMFLEKRVYQGSSGRVYPHPVIDKIEDDKAPKPYKLVILENEYIRIEIMPELGGRIYRALDKTNDYDFVYYNRVIKPALVGLAGPWISGGIEFNWPQHHRPNTFGPVEYKLEQREDGAATVWVGEIDRMYGTKMTAGFTLFPGKAYLEIHAQVYNRTAEPQTFLWWANPAVAVNEHTQSVFPPDVNAVFDHGKRDVSRFPIATGTYYKTDYSEGVDISWYKNIPVPTSYMAYKSDYNFIGGYDHSVQAGLLHVANRHVSPGKKQWTWGCGDFGKAWDRNLTDEDGPYIELMTGVYTDNQPDFTWLAPYEEKSFRQYFMPYKNIGVVKNASVDAAVNLEVDADAARATVKVYATSPFQGARIELASSRRVYIGETADLSPAKTYARDVRLEGGDQAFDLSLRVKDASGRLLVGYRPKRPDVERLPDAAQPLPEPQELATNEQLYLAGLHLEQYRHATFEPEAYYLEGLKRDKSDMRINVAYGMLLMRRGCYQEAEVRFREAIARSTWRNPNPYDGEAHYQLGLCLKRQQRYEEAFAALYKSVWSAAWQDAGYYTLAQIACRQGSYEEALELVDRSLIRNASNYKARHLKTALLRLAGRTAAAIAHAGETIGLDPIDFGSRCELVFAYRALEDDRASAEAEREWLKLTRRNAFNHLALAADYADAGLYPEAAFVLEAVAADAQPSAYPMIHYALGYAEELGGDRERAEACFRTARSASSDYCFPNSLFELEVLLHATAAYPHDAKAHYYLGNLFYDKKRYDDAIRHWEASRALDDRFATVHRNLALAYFNKRHDPDRAAQSLEKAFACDPSDARILYELDQLRRRRGIAPAQRLAELERHLPLVMSRDDLYLEYVTLHNSTEQYDKAASLLGARRFHPWEGGEGKTTGQYALAHVEMAKRAIRGRDYEKAVELLRRALVFPENLGEGKLAGAQENNIHYYLGCAYEGLGKRDEAAESFRMASIGLEEPASAMYYNDQPPEMILYQGLAWLKRGDEKEAKRRFNRLIDYAERSLFEEVKIDYFAVSLPDFLVFDDDLNRRNRIHCLFMLGLGMLGLGKYDKACEHFAEVLRMDSNHQGAILHMALASEQRVA